jgi:hypothetical protein
MVANPDGGVAVLYAAGHLVGGSDTTFAGYLAVGDTDGWVMVTTRAWRTRSLPS